MFSLPGPAAAGRSHFGNRKVYCRRVGAKRAAASISFKEMPVYELTHKFFPGPRCFE